MKEKIRNQVELFKSGFPSLELKRAATLGDGILILDDEQKQHSINTYSTAQVDVEKFVPASGAATRMFKELLELKNQGIESQGTAHFFERTNEFPFKLSGDQKIILETLFDEWHFDLLPKGLLPFHKYDSETRTPAQEHLVEAIGYAMKKEPIKIHFTVSPEHQDDFINHLDNATELFEKPFELTFSTQKPETDTVAVSPENEPIMKVRGEYLFRPAGHGALLENLNERGANILFIKNIDNVVPDKLKSETIFNKKVLAGILLDYQHKVFDLLERSEKGQNIENEGKALLESLGLKGELNSDEIKTKLNRPIRVCGMVKNEGEPGGGPFWVKSNGLETLQIVESAQVDGQDKEQVEVFNQSTHFNPVDIVCGVRNFQGNKFDLLKFRDPSTGFIANKSYQGKPIKAMELPGLWNGGMADWNTIFVEVPSITFNPVKTVNDLLRPEHQA